jgi:hypothetical protein
MTVELGTEFGDASVRSRDDAIGDRAHVSSVRTVKVEALVNAAPVEA